MAKQGRPSGLTAETGMRFVNTLGDGSPPFLKLACHRAGLSYDTVKGWIEKGERSDDDDSDYRGFALEVRRIRAKWMNEAMEFMQSATKESGERARQLQWILTRLERETFDISVKTIQGDAPQPKAKLSPVDIKAAEADLEMPE